MDKKIIIIGAGPTGLGAGYRLKELGCHDFRIYDRNSFIGGLSASFTDSAGFTWDIGGHVMFSHYEYFDKVFAALLGDEFRLNMRESWVRMFDRWVPYPFQNNIRYLPREACFECLAGLIKAQCGTARRPNCNYAEFMNAVFGEGICRHFMRPYNFKVWAHPAEMMNSQWIGERVAVIDVERALRNVLFERDDFGWGPNNQFKYPLRGGTGELYRRFQTPLAGHIVLQKQLESIDIAGKRCRFADGQEQDYDLLISTMPVDQLCASARGLPAAQARAARQLSHSGGHIIGVGIRQPCPSTKSWMYFPEGNCPFYRVTYLSNYSPNMTPANDRYYSLLCETSYSSHKPVNSASIEEDTIRGLIAAGMISERDRDDIVSVWHYQADYSYPVPTVERDAALKIIVPYLQTRNIYSRGRFGLWKYEISNTDHSLMQGAEVVNRLLLNEPETVAGGEWAAQATPIVIDRNVAAVAVTSPLAAADSM